MQYWDSSALVAIVLDEKRSAEMRLHLDRDPEIITSILTPIEIASAVSRRAHHRDLTPEQHARATATFADLAESWIEVSDFGLIREVALDLLTRHLLRAGDAVQLASAITSGPYPHDLLFLTLDTRLADAARAEGFTVLP